MQILRAELCKNYTHVVIALSFFLCMATRTFRASLREGGGPQVDEVTCGGLPHLKCTRDHIKMRDYMDRRVTPHKRVTSPTWGPPSPCEQALTERRSIPFSGTYWS